MERIRSWNQEIDSDFSYAYAWVKKHTELVVSEALDTIHPQDAPETERAAS